MPTTEDRGEDEQALANLLTARAVGYLRPTTRFTLVPRASLLPGLGLWASTRPTRLERARRMRPTEQCLARIRVRALRSVKPITLGTAQRILGGLDGGGGGGGSGGGPVGGGGGGPGGGTQPSGSFMAP